MQADCFAELRRFMLVKNYTATSNTLRDVQRYSTATHWLPIQCNQQIIEVDSSWNVVRYFSSYFGPANGRHAPGTALAAINVRDQRIVARARKCRRTGDNTHSRG